LEPPNLSEKAFFRLERDRALQVCREKGVYSDLRDHLSLILESCGEVPLFVVIIPDVFQVDDALWSAIENDDPGAHLIRQLPQHVITRFLSDLGVQYLDLLPAIREDAAENPGKRYYRLRNTHFNVAGNAVAGRMMAEFLRSVLPN
jgi:hypothetical protein